MTPIESAERALRRSAPLIVAGLLLLAVVYVWALGFTPPDVRQGLAQKIFYIHVPSAWVGFLGLLMVGVASVVYLVRKDPVVDIFAASAAEVGMVFTTVVLITGPIWGRSAWGAWWTWDVRLTSTLFLWFVVLAYLVLRSSVTDPAQRARYSAVLGILGAALVPFVYLSIYLFRQDRMQHPGPVVIKAGGPTLPGSMLATLLFSLGVFTLFFAALLWRRFALARLADALAQAAAERDDA
jgi:heme exporter protein C